VAIFGGNIVFLLAFGGNSNNLFLFDIGFKKTSG
jgi:hypothetical protein